MTKKQFVNKVLRAARAAGADAKARARVAAKAAELYDTPNDVHDEVDRAIRFLSAEPPGVTLEAAFQAAMSACADNKNGYDAAEKAANQAIHRAYGVSNHDHFVGAQMAAAVVAAAWEPNEE